MKKTKVNTIDELKKTKKDKTDEIVITGDLIGQVKKATLLKNMFYWIILISLLLCFNFGMSSKLIDFYSIFQLRALGLTRTTSIVLILFFDIILFVFGLMKSKVSGYKISYIDKLYQGGGSISLIKVWYY